MIYFAFVWQRPYLLFCVPACFLVHPVLVADRQVNLIPHQIDQLLDLFDGFRVEIIVNIQTPDSARVVGFHQRITELRIDRSVRLSIGVCTIFARDLPPRVALGLSDPRTSSETQSRVWCTAS